VYAFLKAEKCHRASATRDKEKENISLDLEWALPEQPRILRAQGLKNVNRDVRQGENRRQ
jgi:hypothetical protein